MKKIIIVLAIILIIFVIGYPFLNPSSDKNKAVPSVSSEKQVTQPSQEDILRTFFSLINEKRIPEAIEMLSPTIVPDDTSKQAWGVQFNSFKNIEVTDIKKQAEYEGSGEIYRIDLSVEVNAENANLPIPYYGWSNGQNVRWIEIVKENNLWKITRIATGP